MSDKRSIVKKVILIVFSTIVILFPTILAIFTVIPSGTSDTDKSTFSVSICDPEGNEILSDTASSDDTDSSSLASIFSDIYNNMRKSSQSNPDETHFAPLNVIIKTQRDEVKLTYYFSSDGEKNFCITEGGQYYYVYDEDAERFLTSKYSESLYSAATAPSLTISGDSEILPQSISWFYKNVNGEFVAAQDLETEPTAQLLESTGGIPIRFSLPPTSCTVTAYHNSTKIYEGDMDDLSSVTLTADSVIDIKMRATWSHSDNTDFYGSASYAFSVTVHNRASIDVSRTQMKKGEFIVVRATQINSPADLIFSSDQIVAPQFTMVGNTAYAVIPFPDSISSNLLQFSLSYGVTSKSFAITLTGGTSLPSQLQMASAATAMGVDLSAGQNRSHDNPFVLGTIIPPDEAVWNVRTAYGDVYNETSTSFFTQYASNDKYVHTVSAAIAGKVIYVGSDKVFGNFVVLEIGLGMRLRYAGIQGVQVEVGDFVAAGGILGRSSVNPDQTTGFYTILTYNERPLSTAVLFKDGYVFNPNS